MAWCTAQSSSSRHSHRPHLPRARACALVSEHGRVHRQTHMHARPHTHTHTRTHTCTQAHRRAHARARARTRTRSLSLSLPLSLSLSLSISLALHLPLLLIPSAQTECDGCSVISGSTRRSAPSLHVPAAGTVLLAGLLAAVRLCVHWHDAQPVQYVREIVTGAERRERKDCTSSTAWAWAACPSAASSSAVRGAAELP